VVPLQYVTAADLERALEPLTPPGAQIKSDAIRNILIVSGSDSDVRSIVNNIATFDVDMLHGLSFALLPLRNAKAREIANDVTNMLKSSGRSIADMVKINPIDRMNAVLVTSMQPAYLERVRGLVERFDRGAGGAEQQLFVYRVQMVVVDRAHSRRPHRPTTPEGLRHRQGRRRAASISVRAACPATRPRAPRHPVHRNCKAMRWQVSQRPPIH
jgi:type II secretory pathway component GspD/PulD (secretin)